MEEEVNEEETGEDEVEMVDVTNSNESIDEEQRNSRENDTDEVTTL